MSDMSDRHTNSEEKIFRGKRLSYVGYLVVSLSLLGTPEYTSAFTFHAPSLRQIKSASLTPCSRLFQSENPEQDIDRTLARAKELLEKSKAKLAAKGEEQDAVASKEGKTSPVANLPFFADRDGATVEEKRRQVTKSQDEDTGLITTDGEMMAKLSEEEKWEVRSLDDVFKNEIEADGESEKSKSLAERDIAASIRSMRTIMKMEDYKKIFDTRNRFIGEDN
mmetsp:Transcript_23231/g.27970  ORF Transcript_23231/g.27970 Transcript_23231/m.27970 type:complete len:222 (-) Transcript_23231:61-726(-)